MFLYVSASLDLEDVPRATRQEPMVRRMYLVSEKVLNVMQRSVRFEGELLLTHSVAMMQHTALTRPDMRTPHPNPTDTNRRWRMIGKTTPPNMVLASSLELTRSTECTDAGSGCYDSRRRRSIFAEVGRDTR